ncbi:MAG: MOSC domain-containing protein [Cyanobacteria bacterium P01_F01_bin.143]
METGQIEAIWIKRGKRAPMDAVECAEMIAGKGLVGNANQGGRRQVTILDAAVWEGIMEELGATIDPSARRANIMVRGLDLANTRKRILLLDECRVRIFTETKPCERMDEVFPGLKAALYPNWAGGASAQVIDGGMVRVGAVARWEN